MSNKSTIRIKNMKVLMIERFKFLNDLSPPTMNGIFQKQEKNYCSLRNTRSLVSKREFTTTDGIDTISEDLKFGKIFLNSDSLNLSNLI